MGGATGSIGDPSGRSTERTELDPNLVYKNASLIGIQLEKILKNAQDFFSKSNDEKKNTTISPTRRVLNNLDWTKSLSLLEFLSQVGRHARVGIMLARER